MLDEEKLKEIEERATAATPGPWEWDGPLVFLPDGAGLIADCHGTLDTEEQQQAAEADATFIAAARADVPALVAEVRKLRAILTELVDLKEIHDRDDPAWGEDNDPENYVERKPRAWAAAREALGRDV